MNHWIAAMPSQQVVYFAACEMIYRGLVADGVPIEPLGDHFDILAGYAFKSSDYASEGIRLLRNINVKPDRIDWGEAAFISADEAGQYERFRLGAGDLVMSMDGTVNRQGIKIAFLAESDLPALLLQRVCRFDPLGSVEKRFLYHVLHSEDFLEHLDDSNRSIAIPHVSPGQLKSFGIPIAERSTQVAIAGFLDSVRHAMPSSTWPALPPPLAEQRLLVARIEELATRVHEAGFLRQQAAEEANVLHAKMLESVFAPFLNGANTVGEHFRVTTGATPSRANPAYWNGDINWVSSGDVAFCRIRGTSEKITGLGLDNSSARVYRPGTVLLAMIGQGKTRGQCALLDCHACTNQNVAAIHVHETEHSAEYVYWWLFASYQRSRAVETGTAQPALSGERVRQMRIPLPPLCEQHRIVEELDALQAQVDELKRLQAETAAELDALLPAILDRAFKGEL